MMVLKLSANCNHHSLHIHCVSWVGTCQAFVNQEEEEETSEKRRERNQERQIHQNLSPLSTCSVSQQLPESFYKQKVNRSLLTISPSYLLHPTFSLTVYSDLFLFSPSNILVSNYQPVLTLKTQAVQFSILRFFQYNK